MFWLYVTELTLLILHEMDSTYWKEWDLFHLPGGQAGFLLLHLPLWPLAIYGAVQVWNGTSAGTVYAIVVAAAGLVGFGLHTYFLRTGHPEFDTPVSKAILWGMLLVSLAMFIVILLDEPVEKVVITGPSSREGKSGKTVGNPNPGEPDVRKTQPTGQSF